MGDEQSDMEKPRTHVGMGAHWLLGLLQIVSAAESRSVVMERVWGHHALGNLQYAPGMYRCLWGLPAGCSLTLVLLGSSLQDSRRDSLRLCWSSRNCRGCRLLSIHPHPGTPQMPGQNRSRMDRRT